MNLITFIFPYLMLIRTMLLTVSSLLLFTAFMMIVLRANNLNLLNSLRGSPSKNPADLRKHARYATIGMLELPEGGNAANSSASLMNLSAKGVSFVTPHVFQVGQEISCRVHAHNKQPERVTGSVVWVRAKARFYQYGVEFKSLVPQFAKPAHENPNFRTLRAWGTS